MTPDYTPKPDGKPSRKLKAEKAVATYRDRALEYDPLAKDSAFVNPVVILSMAFAQLIGPAEAIRLYVLCQTVFFARMNKPYFESLATIAGKFGVKTAFARSALRKGMVFREGHNGQGRRAWKIGHDRPHLLGKWSKLATLKPKNDRPIHKVSGTTGVPESKALTLKTTGPIRPLKTSLTGPIRPLQNGFNRPNQATPHTEVLREIEDTTPERRRPSAAPEGFLKALKGEEEGVTQATTPMAIVGRITDVDPEGMLDDFMDFTGSKSCPDETADCLNASLEAGLIPPPRPCEAAIAGTPVLKGEAI